MTLFPSRWSRGALVVGGMVVLAWSFFLWIPGKNVILLTDIFRLAPPWTFRGALTQNLLLTDPVWQFYPWLTGFRQAILHGRPPLWDPNIFCGVPIAANPQAAYFFPLTWIVLPLGVGAGMSAIAVLRPALAAIFTFAYLRRGGFSSLASFFGAITYGLSRPFLVWAQYPLDNVFLLAPLVLLAIDEVIEKPSRARQAFLAVVVGATGLGGHPESTLHVAAFAAAYALVQSFRAEGGPLRPFGRAAAGALWGGALALFGLLPQARVILASAALHHPEHATSPMPARMLLGAILPRFFAVGSTPIPTPDVPWNLNESACYYGLVAVVLSLTLLARSWRSSRLPRPLFWSLSLVAMAVLVFVAPRATLFREIPVLGQVFHNRLTVLAALPLGVLAATACERLRVSFEGVGKFVLASAFLAAAIVLLPPAAAGRSAASVDLIFAVAALAIASLGLWLGTRFGPSIALVFLCLVQLGDLWHAGGLYNPRSPVAAVFPPFPSASTLRAFQGADGRILPMGPMLPPNSAEIYGLRDVRGYDAVESTRYAAKRHRLALWGADMGMPTDLLADGFTPESARLMALFGIRGLALPSGAALSPRALAFLPAETALVTVAPDATIYALRGNPGRFQAVGRVVPAPAHSVDPRLESRVEGIRRALTFAAAGNARMRLEHDEPERIDLTTSASGPFFLRISDAFDPGWSATLDGSSVPIFRTDEVFRGVFLPAGTHRLSLRYALPGTPWTIVVSALAALMAVGAFLPRRRSKISGTAATERINAY